MNIQFCIWLHNGRKYNINPCPCNKTIILTKRASYVIVFIVRPTHVHTCTSQELRHLLQKAKFLTCRIVHNLSKADQMWHVRKANQCLLKKKLFKGKDRVAWSLKLKNLNYETLKRRFAKSATARTCATPPKLID